jgi:hypothetical protein
VLACAARVVGFGQQYVKAWIAIAVVVVLVTRAVLRRRSARTGVATPTGARIERGSTAALVLLAVLSVGNYFGFSLSPIVGQTQISGYDLLHYYLNAKYFDELGYVHLYEAVVTADDEGARRFRRWRFKQVRDLDTSEMISIGQVRAKATETRARFTRERWAEFKEDFRFLQGTIPKGQQLSLLGDHGYNGTPLVQTIAGPLTNLVPVQRVKWLCHGETLLLLLMFWVMARKRGLHVTAVAVCWYFLSFSARWPGVGYGFLRLDWFVALVLACLLLDGADAEPPVGDSPGSPAAPRSRAQSARLVGAGLLLAYSAAMKIFPAVWLFGLGVRALWRLGTTRRVDRVAAVVFASFLAGTILLGGIATTVVGRDNVQEFAEDIREHLHPLNLSSQRMGFGVALGYRGEIHAWPAPGARRARYIRVGQLTPLRYAGALLALVLLGLTIRPSGSPNAPARTGAADATQLGFIPFYFLMIASHYYWIHRMTIVLHHAPRTDDEPDHLVALSMLLCVEAIANSLDTWTHFRYGVVGTSSVMLAVYAAWVIGARLRRVLRSGGVQVAQPT